MSTPAEVESIGDMDIDAFDDANVPVDLWLIELDDDTEAYDEGFRWKLTVGNYMPRKSRVEEAVCEYIGVERQPLADIVSTHVLPLYRSALACLEAVVAGEDSSLYYWKAPHPETTGAPSGEDESS